MSKSRKLLFTVLATLVAFVMALTVCPNPAFAADDDEPTYLQQLQTEVENTSEAYNEAQKKVDDLNEQISENEALIAELEEQIPVQKEHTAAAISRQYKLQQDTPSLLMLLLSAEDFNEFVTTLSYLDAVSNRSASAVEVLVDMENQLQEARRQLEADKSIADEQLQEADEALKRAQAAREEAQQAALARAAAEAAAAQAAVQAAQAAQAQQQQFTPDSNAEPVEIAIPSADSPSAISWSTDKESFINEWAPRINAYLGNAPLGGYGEVFAEAAWDYGVDPRWSPAISCVESSKGSICFLPHNAWGWGNISWATWEEAIRDHVAGLSRGYGYTISIANAQKYCPPNWQFWYSTCLSEMERI